MLCLRISQPEVAPLDGARLGHRAAARRLVAASLALLVASTLVACRDGANEAPDSGPIDGHVGDGGTGYPAPRDNLVPPVGGAATFDLACWNIENFPQDPLSSAALVADLITSLRLDVVVVEEVASEAAWNELIARLPEHEGVLSPHVYSATEYQKLGVIYRKPLVSVGQLRLLFNGQTGPFPRPPIQLSITVDDGQHARLGIDLIGVHLKAGVTTDDRNRRTEAVALLDNYLRSQIGGGGEDEVVVLGDYNEVVTDAGGQAALAPFLTNPSLYKLQTVPYAQGGGITYLGFGGKAIDHVLTTAGLGAELQGADVTVPRLDQSFGGYQTFISDHLPVVLRIPLR